ncbi:pyridoxal phosphate enzyme [Raineya orbicola]|uniref:Pyridoxal phosphate homeostasis protein n=2 Tax=Raineya orbicola TaxID=2016530 RepID=A0A2N3IK30_9BACT|nr:pyridoxal phosphate enzyme [Raineya orbicola]
MKSAIKNKKNTMFNQEVYQKILQEIGEVRLIAVSKTKPISDLQEAYQAGVRDFGENKVQEMCEKQPHLPQDVRWHLIGHLQTNKVKYIASFVHLIHSVDSLKLLQEINKQAQKHSRVINCLLQIHIAQEETKFGLSYEEAENLLQNTALKELKNIRIKGLMGMATFTENAEQIRKEFRGLAGFFQHCKQKYQDFNLDFQELSMGMSGDYLIAIQEGSTMVRIGSALFGSR